MANLIRSAKSASDWTKAELDAYNINLVKQDAATFFETPNLPQCTVNEEILFVEDAENMSEDSNQELMALLDDAMNISNLEESTVDDFTVSLFRTLGYSKGLRVTHTRKHLSLLICGERRKAQTDVCLLDRSNNNILLLVEENKRFNQDVEFQQADGEAQLIAEAIAAFSINNVMRSRGDMPPLASEVIPGIVMTGTMPIFYKIPVTTQLEAAILHGTYPVTPTIVAYHIPETPRPNRRWREGMKPLDNRKHILRCYEAFKAIIGI
ncbi:hypothetical protein BU17DRAFT_75382 [Hysterangium stoloniferum]|nr:hypothetical protein BU17DRAFT_75382 [Hysterangium stoloniferum]